MRLQRRLIERYTVAATLPYFLLSLLLLTSVLLAQQGTRFAEILGAARAPLSIAAEVLVGLLPSILVFTLPMSVLAGTATGFSRMNSDSELVSMRAAGIGMGKIVAPTVLFGALVSLFTLYIGLELAPDAAYGLRRTALRAALYRLESPVEPRAFNTEMPGKIVYVRDGDRETGQWGRVFIYWQEPGGPVRLVTARSGRIDTTDERSELVLSDAVVTTLPETSAGTPAGKGDGKASPSASTQQMTTERSTQLRIRDDRMNSTRESLLKRLHERDLEPDEMNWRELWRRARHAPEEAQRRAASFTLHRRLSLCTAPLVFAFLGATIGLRLRRGGRGLGMLLSLAVMIGFYLVALGGEYLARVGTVPAFWGAWLATFMAFLLGVWLLLLNSLNLYPFRSLWSRLGNLRRPAEVSVRRKTASALRQPLLTGLLDRTVFQSLLWNFGLAWATLVSIFLIFTLFELLRFIAVSGAGAALVLRYLLYLIPFATIALAPMSVLVAVLFVYALLARRSEAIAWWACGQSVYRLALPGLVFAACIGLSLWVVQERLMPEANRLQNLLRARIRGGVSRAVTTKGRQWLATEGGQTIYSYVYEEQGERLSLPVIYEFDGEGVHLRRVVEGESGEWREGGALVIKQAEVLGVGDGGGEPLRRAPEETVERREPQEVFKPTLNNPAEMDIKQLSNYLNTLKQRGEAVAPLVVALERKRSDPFSPLVMALLGVPLALAFGRRSAMAALSAAVVIGLAFWGTLSGFQQLGSYSLLPAKIAVWSPLVIFAAAGVYLLFRSKT